MPPGVVAPGVSAPCVVAPGVVVPSGVVLPGVAVGLAGVTVPLPAPVAGGAVFTPGPPVLLHGAMVAEVADDGGVVVFAPAPAVAPAREVDVDEPAPPREDPLTAVSLPLRVEPVVPTAVELPFWLPFRRVSSPARAVDVLLVPAPLRATEPVVEVPARAVSFAGTHGSALAFGPDVPGCVAPVGEPGCLVPDWEPLVAVVPGDVTPDVPVCVGLVDGVLVLWAWSGTMSAAVSSAPPADNANFAFTWTFLSLVSY